MNPVEIVLAVDLTRREVNSAMPWAPVIDDRKTPRQPVQALRATAARALRRAADRVEPKCAVTYG